MTDEIEKQRGKIQRLRTTNAGLAHEIETLGGGVDLGTARVEHLILHLVQQGIMTDQQQVDEMLHWETGLRSQLISIRDGLRSRLENAAKAKAKREAERRAAAKPLEKAEAPSLILPPGVKK